MINIIKKDTVLTLTPEASPLLKRCGITKAVVNYDHVDKYTNVISVTLKKRSIWGRDKVLILDRSKFITVPVVTEPVVAE